MTSPLAHTDTRDASDSSQHQTMPTATFACGVICTLFPSCIVIQAIKCNEEPGGGDWAPQTHAAGQWPRCRGTAEGGKQQRVHM